MISRISLRKPGAAVRRVSLVIWVLGSANAVGKDVSGTYKIAGFPGQTQE